jgi:hypothetical protein
MNRHQRRAAEKRMLKQCFKDMHAEGQGVWKFTIITPQMMPALIGEALAGNDYAGRVCLMVPNTLKQLADADPRALCLLCDNEFSADSVPLAFVLITAHRDDPATGLMNGLCSACSQKPHLEQLVFSYYRENVIRDARLLWIASAAGQA